jgi:hypothetical protein
MTQRGSESRPTRAWPLAAAAALTGVCLGIVFFTFHYAEGFSYFSTDPKALAARAVSPPARP